MTNAFIVLQANAFSAGGRTRCVSDEHYMAGDERASAQTSTPHSYMLPATFKQTSLEIATHR